MKTAIHSKCAKCAEDIAESSMLIGDKIYHVYCSPYAEQQPASPPLPKECTCGMGGEAAGSELEAVAWQWRALEDGEPRTAWKDPELGDRPGWEALAKRNPEKYATERRALYTERRLLCCALDALEAVDSEIVLTGHIKELVDCALAARHQMKLVLALGMGATR